MFYQYAHETLDALVDEIGINKKDIIYTIATGYGRKIFKEADENISEITANAVGARAAAKDHRRD